VKQAAAGLKFLSVRNGLVAHNQIQGNLGTGVWFDASSWDAQVVSNFVDSNMIHGINFEISGGGTGSDPGTVISGNYVYRNGTKSNRNCSGAAYRSCAGIHVFETAHVTVKGNVLDGNQTNITVIESGRHRDPSKPCGPREACDPRYAQVNPVTHVANSGINFDVAAVKVTANTYRDSYNLTGPMFTVADSTHAKDACQMGVSLSSDTFAVPFIAVWADCGKHGNMTTYTKLTTFQSATHQEAGAHQL
jgi:hypothetical protein